ncbi:MAG TPA: DNA (cytosine-5-)-methyltransferase [Marine Group III euryarchaeote]|uniref:DNA (Cytosine-5-)-methyltransferase n=2 Tax=root TaxID=1 RepID=A0A7J4D0M4_9ARCH|nr:DNA (cytosine-5-)-methyltransferase [Marine Group III euryarchaeote]
MSNSVVELFAGVGGFHLAAKESGWKVIWANQWEPGVKVQHAFDCYTKNFPDTVAVNDDIANVIRDIPKHDLLVGGFPCQDYSVAATKAKGIQGKKGVLWWEISRVIKLRKPPYVLLENVDRLLKSPTAQRGRDFAIMLATFEELGYTVEWRVVNAADYGYPQRRRRVFIFAWRNNTDWGKRFKGCQSREEWLGEAGLFPTVFGTKLDKVGEVDLEPKQTTLADFTDDARPKARSRKTKDPADSERLLDISNNWQAYKLSPFKKTGIMAKGKVWTANYDAVYDGERKLLGDVLEPKVTDPWFYLDKDELESWKYLKGSKKEERIVKATGFKFTYAEGPLPFPDPIDRPSRTMITGEGGKAPSRFKHVIKDSTRKLRRITPVEAERLNGFPDDWTLTDTMPLNFRYFCMGNALVVPLVTEMMKGIQ